MKIVSGILRRSDKVLLCLRRNTLHFPDYWSLPVGHVEKGENTIDALRRELFEELGVQMLNGEMLTRLFDNEQNIQHTVYQVIEWRGKIENHEPELCAAVDWFSIDNLPKPLTPATLTILQSI